VDERLADDERHSGAFNKENIHAKLNAGCRRSSRFHAQTPRSFIQQSPHEDLLHIAEETFIAQKITKKIDLSITFLNHLTLRTASAVAGATTPAASIALKQSPIKTQ